MIQRFEAPPSRLAIRDGGTVSPDETAGTTAGSIMRLPDGDVAADLKATGIRGGRVKRATYELLVTNDTSAPLATFTYAPDGKARGRLTWSAIVVPPFSAIAVEIDVALGRRRGGPRVVAELFSEDAQLTIDAPGPQRNGAAFVRRAVASAAVFLGAVAAAAAFAQSRPHVLALAAPSTVRANTPFSVAYALGAGHGRYVVETPDGLQVGRGVLEARTGAFTVALPSSPASVGYDVRVSTTGGLGSDERTAHVVALAAAPPIAAKRVAARAVVATDVKVGELALERDTVHAGEAIVATYRATTTTGMVRLIDAFGTVRAEALLTPRGRSILVAPNVDANQDFRVVATVERGTTRAEAVSPVTVLHGPATPSVAATGSDPAATGAAAVAVPRGSAPIAVDRMQSPTRPIVVRIDRYQRGLHVALIGSSTDELSGSDVAPGDASVVLRPPDVISGSRYAVVATYATGFGQETLIRPIAFRAP
ncbi:MAG: hypothetical protein NVS1B2_23800 [Vulcanimicrobiaceae bacterium]